MFKSEHVVKEQDLDKLIKENPYTQKIVQHLKDFENIEIGIVLFMGLPVADHDSINKLHLKLHGYIECLLENEMCTQSQCDLLKASLDEIHFNKVKPRSSSTHSNDVYITDEDVRRSGEIGF